MGWGLLKHYLDERDRLNSLLRHEDDARIIADLRKQLEDIEESIEETRGTCG